MTVNVMGKATSSELLAGMLRVRRGETRRDELIAELQTARLVPVRRPEWAYEYKLDGYRAAMRIAPDGTTVLPGRT